MNLIIDGHAMLNVVSPVALYLLKQNVADDEIFDANDELTDAGKSFFRTFAMRFISNIIIPYKDSIKHVYMVLDNDSWRKYYMEKYYNRNPEVPVYEYKDNRKKAKEKNTRTYKFFRYFIDEMIPDLNTIDGVTQLTVRGAEGDDLIAYLASKVDGHTVIWSGDMDLGQLLRWDKTITFMVTPKRQGTEHKMVYLPIRKSRGMDLNDAMMDFSSAYSFFSNNRDYVIEESDFNIELLVKIIGGDKGDNIPGIYHYLSDTNKHMGISEKQAREIVTSLVVDNKYNPDSFMDLIDAYDAAFLNDVVNATFNKKGLMKKNDERRLKAQILENLKLNIRLIRLSKSTIPSILLDTIEQKLNIVRNSKPFDYGQFVSYVKLDSNMI